MKSGKSFNKLLKLAERHPRPSPWWFRPAYADADYSRRFHQIYGVDAEVNPEVVNFFTSRLSPGAMLLDIGCGNGAFCRAMAKQGFQATGIDIGPFPIEQLQEQSAKTSDTCRWICDDFLRAEFEGEFDCIALLGGQLKEFPPDEVARIIERTKSLLAPDGFLVADMEYLHESERQYSSYWYMPEVCLYTDKKALVLGENFYYPEDRIRVLREYALEIQTGRLIVGGSTEKEYTREELETHLKAADMMFEAVYGDWDQSPWTESSRRTIFLARKA